MPGASRQFEKGTAHARSQTEHPRHLGRRHRHHNLSCYSDGLMGYRTPNIDRIADEGMRFTDSYGEQSCTAGPVVVHHRPERVPHRAEQGRHAGRRRRAAGRGPDDRRAAQAAGLRDRAVRQEPPRRPEQVPADRARLRRVLRQPLPPQRRGGAGERRTTRPPRSSRASTSAFRPRGVIHSWATDEDDPTRSTSRVRARRQAADRGHRAADQEADGDHRRRGRSARASTSSSASTRPSTPFFVWFNTTHMHFRTHTKPESRRAGRALAVAVPRHDDRPRQERRHAAGPARRARPRRGHDRHLLHRQRPAHEHAGPTAA